MSHPDAPVEAKKERKKRKHHDELSPDSRVRVAVRVRPHNRADKGDNSNCVTVEDNKLTIDNGQRPSSFTYDHVFYNADQEQVYAAIGESMLQDAFSGYNTTIFAYGQTGSGKTFSLLGNQHDVSDERNQGLLPRVAKELFELSNALLHEDPTLTVKLQVSFMEVYNEKVHDLLQFEGQNMRGRRPNKDDLEELKIKPEKKGKKSEKSFVVENLTKHTVTNWVRVKKLIDDGTELRARSETDMNEVSSRSHSIFTIYISQTHEPPNPEMRDKESKITIVDLAGSERQSKTGVEDLKKLKEAERINYSLLVLGRCLSACSEEKGEGKRHLPIRESALTKILCDIFGGNSKTTMFATVSPSIANFTESLSTLQYAHNAKKIKHKAKVNNLAKQAEITELKEQVKILGKTLLDELEKAAQTKDALEKEIHAHKDEKHLLQQKLLHVQNENEELRKLVEQLRAENAALQAGGASIRHGHGPPGATADTVPASHAHHFTSPTSAQHPSGADIGVGLGTMTSPISGLEHSASLSSSMSMDGSTPMYRRDDDDDEDDADKQAKLMEIQEILMKKLHVANPSVNQSRGNTLPNTARLNPDEPPSTLNTVRGGPGGNLIGASSEIRSYIGHSAAVYSCAFAPSGAVMASASRDRTLKLWNVKKGSELQTLKGHQGFVLSCAFSPHPQRNELCSASDDKTLKTWSWDPNSESAVKKLLTLKGHTDKVYCCAYSPTGNEIASASCDRTIRIWNAESGKKLQTLRGHNSAVFCVAFANNPDKTLVISASDDKTLRLWDWQAGEEKAAFQGHTATVWSCCFSPDDQTVLSASMDGTIKLWDVNTTFSVRTFRGHTAPVHHAIFAKNGEKIVSASRDRTLKIWDTDSGKVLSTLIGHANTVYHCCVFNNLILSCSSDDILKVWNLKV